MTAALLAAGCMVIQDILGTVMVQAEAANRGWLAGFCDAAMWLFGIQTTTLAVTSHGSSKIVVDIAVTVANVVGARLGVSTGRWLLQHFKGSEVSIEDRVTRLERALARRGVS